MKQFITLLFASLSIIGCKNSSGDTNDTAFFGGEIINPKGEQVILYNRKSKVSDTITLDKNNRFNHKINNIKSGVYSFRHGG